MTLVWTLIHGLERCSSARQTGKALRHPPLQESTQLPTPGEAFSSPLSISTTSVVVAICYCLLEICLLHILERGQSWKNDRSPVCVCDILPGNSAINRSPPLPPLFVMFLGIAHVNKKNSLRRGWSVPRSCFFFRRWLERSSRTSHFLLNPIPLPWLKLNLPTWMQLDGRQTGNGRTITW